MRRAAVLLVACGCVAGDAPQQAADPATLVRDGATPTIVRRADLGGSGGPELVVASVSDAGDAFGLGTPYLEVFAQDGEAWRRVFDATGNAPPGTGTPEAMLAAGDESVAVGQTIEVVEVVDLAGDDTSEVVAAISNVGATAGPLELWVISMTGPQSFRTEYYLRTERGGSVAIEGSRIVVEFGVYRRDDPGCCPSILEERTIGYDAASASITMLTRERRRVRAR